MNEDSKGKKKTTTVLLDGDAYALICRKQIEIYNSTGEKVSIQYLVSESIKKGINSVVVDIPTILLQPSTYCLPDKNSKL